MTVRELIRKLLDVAELDDFVMFKHGQHYNSDDVEIYRRKESQDLDATVYIEEIR